MSTKTASLLKSAAAALVSLPAKAASNVVATARIRGEALPRTVASLKSRWELVGGRAQLGRKCDTEVPAIPVVQESLRGRQGQVVRGRTPSRLVDDRPVCQDS